MINMSMRKEYAINLPRVELETEIIVIILSLTLAHTAIDEDLHSLFRQVKAGSCHLPGRPKKPNFHNISYFLFAPSRLRNSTMPGRMEMKIMASTTRVKFSLTTGILPKKNPPNMNVHIQAILPATLNVTKRM